jgi:L-lactate dehydrogenase complex protein LldE
MHNEVKRVQKNLYEISEFLTQVLKIDNLGATFNQQVTYHDACGALRECGIKSGPRQLLSKVKGLQLLEMTDSETCCGFGGTFAVKFEPISTGMADYKINCATQTKAQYMVSTDLSCLMHLQGYIEKNNLPIKTIHLVDVLTQGW